MEKRYQVFVSSTFNDLKNERREVIQTLLELDCIPVGMELFPAADEDQFEYIKRVINDCDYYLLIIGGRYGSLSKRGIGYTELEYEYALERGLKVIALIHGDPGSLPFEKSEPKPELRERLQLFRDRVAENRLVKYWNSANELPGVVALSVQKAIKLFPSVGWIRGTQASNRPLVPYNAGLERYVQIHEEPFLFKPFRENLAAEVTYVRDGNGLFSAQDKVSYVCRSVNNQIDRKLLWGAAPGEFIEIRKIKIGVKPPTNHPKAGRNITLYDGSIDRATCKNSGANIALEIPLELAVDGLRVIYDTQYIIGANSINEWSMGSVTWGFALTMTYPKDLLVHLTPFVPLPEAGNLTVDRPGYFNYQYDEWMMPNDGLAWVFEKTTPKK